MEENKKNTEQGVNEPGSVYHVPSNSGINIYPSFEEQANAQRIYWASLTPQQLLLNLRKLTESSFGVDYDKVTVSQFSNRITIRQYK